MIISNSDYKANAEVYFSYLKAVCALSRLFSDSSKPYLYYRVAENIFCQAFEAENISRDDLAYDAKIGSWGIGLKTFVETGSNLEKIAEFNALSGQLRELQNKPLALRLAELRNERIEFANRTYGIENGIYHCISRIENSLHIFETSYDSVDLANIRNIKTTRASVSFEDGKNEYSFNLSKTTLFKRFTIPEKVIKIAVEILENPLDLIVQLLNQPGFATKVEIPGLDFVILPLYSLRDSKPYQKIVAPQSGLNQWNAGGRKRVFGEVYIPIPAQIHKDFPNFFPSRDVSFKLHVPTGEILSAKVCQDHSKALMTNPNNALADWLLKKVLRLKEGELLTYDRLGIDSVRIRKIDNLNFKIDFSKLDSYEKFSSNQPS